MIGILLGEEWFIHDTDSTWRVKLLDIEIVSCHLRKTGFRFFLLLSFFKPVVLNLVLSNKRCSVFTLVEWMPQEYHSRKSHIGSHSGGNARN